MQSKLAQALWAGIFFASTVMWPLQATTNDELIVLGGFFLLASRVSGKGAIFDFARVPEKKFENIAVLYFLLTACYSTITSYSIYKLRWIVFFSICLIMTNSPKLVIKVSQNSRRIVNWALLYCFSIFFVNMALSIFDTSWIELQGEFVAGPSHAIFPLIVLLSNSLWRVLNHQNNIKDLILFAASIILAEMFDSRFLLLINISMIAILILSKKIPLQKRLFFVIVILFVNFLAQFLNVNPNMFTGSETSRESISQKVQDTSGTLVSAQKAQLEQAVTTIMNPLIRRESDSDRFLHIDCAQQSLQNQNWYHKLFGYGTEEIGSDNDFIECLNFERKGNLGEARIQTIGFNILLIEYGGIGLLIFFSLLVYRCFVKFDSTESVLRLNQVFMVMLSIFVYDGLDSFLLWTIALGMMDWSSEELSS